MSSESITSSTLSLGVCIGEGTFGIVYTGRYKTLKVAVKKLHLSQQRSMNLQSIENEVRMLEQLQCRYIIQFYGSIRHEDEIWLITDYAERGCLKRAIDRGLLEGWEMKRQIAQGIARGLAFIHHEGILHRDLKSANVLLSGRMEVKLCDFGLAIVKGLNETSASEAPCGTLRWMAPELLSGQPQYSTKSDMYALGMVMWEMAAMCTFPFQNIHGSDAVAEAVMRGQREQLPGITTDGDSTHENQQEDNVDYTPDDYRDCVERCWRHDPMKRPEANEISLVDDAPSERWRTSLDANMLSVTDTNFSPRPWSDDASSIYDKTITSASMARSTQETVGIDQQLLYFSDLSRMAMNNISNAQFSLAELYENGNKCVTKDYEKAFTWYLRAANQGHIMAMHRVADMYSTGRGTDRCEADANRWYRKAAALEGSGSHDNHEDLSHVPHEASSRKRENSGSFSWLRRLSRKGLTSAQLNMAFMQGVVDQNDVRAASWYGRAANQGNATAQFFLGFLYENGRGLKQSDIEAVRWYTMAARQDYARAQCNLGWMYEKGRGVQQSDVEAAKWFAKAANQGDLDAQCNLGVMYENGRGVKLSNIMAVKWYTKAANQDSSRAQFCLGVMYETGRGVERSDVAALKWYTKAAKQGNPFAQFNLGVMYAEGRGVKKNDTEAVEWYTKAANQGDPDAQCNLGVMYESGRGVKQNGLMAVQWYVKAADQGNAVAQFNLGCMYENDMSVEQNYREAAEWYTKAADQNNAAAQLSLGLLYENGRGVEQSYANAFKWFTKAANQGIHQAQFSVGWMYENGRGVEQNNKEALKWYTKAANQNNVAAQFNLAWMYKDGRGVDQSDPHAAEWFTKAANQGDVDAQCNLGWMYEKGQGVKRSSTDTVNWFSEAAIGGNPQAQCNLGWMYDLGSGVEQDDQLAFHWYFKSAGQGIGHAEFHVASMYELGIFVERNDEQALDCFRKAAEKEEPNAHLHVEWILAPEHRAPQNDMDAFEVHRVGAENGYAAAQHNLGRIYERGIGVNVDLDKAILWYGRAAANGHTDSVERMKFIQSK
ncbi:hypothetical protein BGW42_001934 [Actinomortierella wolfii]|nr:hypothetical protein BGW42_001934 [Actinomortierella wolfii]